MMAATTDAMVEHPTGRVGKRARRGVAVALALGALMILFGCENDPETSGAFALTIRDRSTSFAQFSADCVPDFMQVAMAVAERSGDLYGGALLGADPFGAAISIEAHFDESPPPAIAGNERLEREFRRRRAASLRSRFDALARLPVVGGSPVLRTLERAARFTDQRAEGAHPVWIVVCSDLANVGSGLDVRRPITNSQVHAAIDRWTPRLGGLRGADLYFVGAGRRAPGADSLPASIRQVERVVAEVASRVGARVRLMDTRLGQRFPLMD